MTETVNKKTGKRSTILAKMHFAPQARNEESKGEYGKGRFTMFRELYKKQRERLMTGGLMTILFALPLIAIVMFVSYIGVENFSNTLNGVSNPPSFLSDFGFGLSKGSGVVSGRVDMLTGYRVMSLAIAVALPILGIGLSGMFYICHKVAWRESFITKKDSYGNDIPRTFKEYFIGIKRFWGQFLLTFFALGIIFAGVFNLILNFVQDTYTRSVGFFSVLQLIVAIVIGLATLLTTANLVPFLVSYDIPYIKKVQNAVILGLALPVPTIFMTILVAGPLALMAIGGTWALIVLLILIVFGFTHYCFGFTLYADYHSEKIITPVYEANLAPKFTEKPKKKPVPMVKQQYQRPHYTKKK